MKFVALNVVVSSIFSALFPARCIRCNRIEKGLCNRCAQSLQIAAGAALPGVEQCWSAGPYSGWLRDSVLKYKSGQIDQLDGLIAVLHRVLQTADCSPELLVSIPSTIFKVRERGFDTVGELSAGLAKQLKVPYRPVLQFARKVQDQVGLDRESRAENLTGAFIAEQTMYGRAVLIDDVITTGATVTTAAKVLRICGATKIFAISLCRT